MALSEIRNSLLTSDEFYSLPVETRELIETYRSNEYWQIVRQTYYEEQNLYPTQKILRAYGIFFEMGDLTLNEMREIFENLPPMGIKNEYFSPGCIQTDQTECAAKPTR